VLTAVDGRAFSSPAGGVRRYVSELYSALGRQGVGMAVDAIGAAPDASLPPVCRSVSEAWSPPTNLGRHAVGVPLTLARGAAAVYHAPAYVAPLWGRAPVVLSVHDIVYASRPEWYPYRRDPLRRWFYRHSVGRARLILVPSTFTADELMRVYGVAATRVRLVPLAPAASFFNASPAPGETREPVLLHVGDLHTRRDLPCAVAVLARLVAVDGRAWRLVLIGRDRGSLAEVRRAAMESGMADRVDHVANVTDAGLREWYGRAFALLYPSRYEGFGLPVAEALAAGLPVVAADAGSVPEVVAEAGCLFGPGDVDAAAALVGALTDAAHFRQRQVLGQARAAQLTWERTAALTLEALCEAAHG